MGLQPKIVKEVSFSFKKCGCCGATFGPENFAPSKSFLMVDGTIGICDNCVSNYLEEKGWDWGEVDKLCQIIDVPFIPAQWENTRRLAGNNAFHKYAEIFFDGEYDNVHWSDYYQEYKALEAQGGLRSELPLLNEEQKKIYRERWGVFDDEAYAYLENLYNGLITTQNVNGALQVDQAIKICKISYEIDKRIEEGVEFDKLLASYDKLVKAAEFTPKNVKNINDFDTVGELVKWLEKKGWKNNYYDNVTRDVVDETILNIQNFNRRLYTNETGIGDDINHRIEMLKTAQSLENDNYYGTDLSADLDKYDNDGYEALMGDADNEFQIDLDGDEEE